MIQKTNPRHGNTAVAPIRAPAPGGTERCWGSWSGRKYYSLEVVQHPLRARMCGFGDKDRRPLAPAAVCKMVVTRDDHSIVEDDEIDIAFLIVTVDLWSEDGNQEMNLVLHPSSQDRIINSYLAHPAKVRRRGSGAASVSSSRPHHQSPEISHATTSTSQYAMRGDPQSNTVTPIVPSQAPQFSQQGYPFSLQQSEMQGHMNFQQAPPYATHQEAPTWTSYTPQSQPQPQPQPFDRSGNSGYAPALHSMHALERNSTSVAGPSESWQPEGNMTASAYRPWPGDPNMVPAAPAPQTNASYNNNADIDPTLRQAHVTHSSPQSGSWGHSALPSVADPSSDTRYEQEQFAGAGPSTQFDGAAYAPVSNAQHAAPFYSNPNYVQSSTPPPSAVPPSPRQTYTRTLVGPLSANACRLKDEHRKPGIFFLFQDLSVRTEGTFRLRLRLMNVGAPSPHDTRSLRTHTDVSPVLAQTFTDPFMVYSAKRFPGVPDTTALSISFGSQGQKLPLRNRHGKQSRKRRRSEDFDGTDEDEDGEGT